MIISRTPFRVSLFGGGTDYPKWYEQYGGAVLGFAIDKYCYISVRRLPPFFEHKHRIVYSVVENVKSIDEIQHPAVKGVLSEHQPKEGVEIHHDGDLPARSGLGSSSSFTVGLANALAAFDGKMVSKRELAREAIRIEHDVIKEKVGCQDQIWAAFGGLNRIDFLKTGEFDVQPAMVSRERRDDLQDHLLLVFTGLSRLAPVMAEKQIDNIGAREKQLSTMFEMVGEAQSILVDENQPIADLGVLLDQSWQLKRELADGVSTPWSMKSMPLRSVPVRAAVNCWAPAVAALCCLSSSRISSPKFVKRSRIWSPSRSPLITSARRSSSMSRMGWNTPERQSLTHLCWCGY